MSDCSPCWRLIVFAIVTSNCRAAAVVLAGLSIAGMALAPLRESVRKAGAIGERVARAGETRLVVARCISVAIPGGLRALMADATPASSREPSRTSSEFHPTCGTFSVLSAKRVQDSGKCPSPGCSGASLDPA